MKRKISKAGISKGPSKVTKRAAPRLPSPAPRLSGSPAPKKAGKAAPAGTRLRFAKTPGPGAWTVLYLRDPREKYFAVLLRMEPAGVWIRGIELESFESWARERAARAESSLGLASFFVPFLRVEKMVMDERMGPVPSFAERFEVITGRSLGEDLAE
jgi:hypothetical protein